MLHRFGKSRRGYTLSEMAVVMAVIGVVLGALWGMQGKATQQQRVNDAVAELQYSAAGITDVVQGQALNGSVGSYFTRQMLNGNAIPSQYRNPNASAADGSDAADHPWGKGLFRVYKQAADAFRIGFYIVPTDACIQLLKQGTSCPAGTLACPQKVLVKDGTVTKSPDATTGWQSLTVPEAKNLCDNNVYPTTDATKNSVQFEYSVR